MMPLSPAASWPACAFDDVHAFTTPGTSLGRTWSTRPCLAAMLAAMTRTVSPFATCILWPLGLHAAHPPRLLVNERLHIRSPRASSDTIS